MRRALAFIGIGCGGLLALVLVIGILGAIIGGQQDRTGSKDSEQEETTSEY